MVQRWSRNQSGRTPQLHRGGAETGNCSGEMSQSGCLTLRVYLCTVWLWLPSFAYMSVNTPPTPQKCADPSRFVSTCCFSVVPQRRNSKITTEIAKKKKNLWSVFKILQNKSINYLTLLHFPPVLPSVLSVSHHLLSKLTPIPLCCVQTSVRVAFTDLAFLQPLYKHDVTCVPISARLPSRHSWLCRPRNLEKTKSSGTFLVFVLPENALILLDLLSVRPSVCPCAFLLLRHICVLSCTHRTRDSLPFRMNARL